LKEKKDYLDRALEDLRRRKRWVTVNYVKEVSKPRVKVKVGLQCYALL
jgi:hypothetical protein